ncbi:MAG: hypothetical protein GYB67_09670, partial [Chloroflexi bacterium]|nr:hypothetical protein [Chloroflexota bacterium]
MSEHENINHLFQTPVFTQLAERPFAHCATITVMPDGEGLLAAWMGGAYETAQDVALLTAYKPSAEAPWSRPWVIAEVAGHSLGQPVFFHPPNPPNRPTDGELWLFFVVIMGHDWTSAQIHWQRS